MSHNAHIVMDFNEAEGRFNIEALGNQLGKMLCFALGAAHIIHESALDQTGKGSHHSRHRGSNPRRIDRTGGSEQ